MSRPTARCSRGGPLGDHLAATTVAGLLAEAAPSSADRAGLLLAVVVTAASTQDRDGAKPLVSAWRRFLAEPDSYFRHLLAD
jgi:hypothetical protein